MTGRTALSNVRWSLELEPGSQVVTAVCVDTLTQQRLTFNLPAHTIPGLIRVLEELVEQYADGFPTVLFDRLTVTSDGES